MHDQGAVPIASDIRSIASHRYGIGYRVCAIAIDAFLQRGTVIDSYYAGAELIGIARVYYKHAGMND